MGDPARDVISVVCPVHDEVHNLPVLTERLRAVLQALDREWEIVLVDDGSHDESWFEITRLAQSDHRIRGLRLARNFGHQIALTAGLYAAKGRYVITMDSDLQHPPEIIPEMVGRADEGHSVVYAVRSQSDAESWVKVACARWFYVLLNRLTLILFADRCCRLPADGQVSGCLARDARAPPIPSWYDPLDRLQPDRRHL